MVKRRGVIMNGQEVYQTFDRIERTLKELRDAETYLEKTMLRIRIAQAELGNLKQYIKYEVKKDD